MADAVRDMGQELLLQRERKALLVTMRARAMFAIVTTLAIWLVAGELEEKLASSIVLLPIFALSLWLSRLLVTSVRLQFVGLGGVVLDSFVLCALPVIWHLVLTAPDRPLVHLLGHQLGLVAFCFIILNCGALRPLYPAVMTIVAAGLHLLLALIAINDPRLETFPGGLEAAVGLREGVNDLFLKPWIILMGGGALVWITAGARTTVREVVEREQREHQMRQEQMHMVLQAQVSALGQLVAGVEHEVNSPLGAVRSASATASKAVSMLREALASEDPLARQKSAKRAVAALEGSIELTTLAGERLSEVMSSISRFVHLDRAKRQPVDIASCVQDATRLIAPHFNDRVELKVDLPPGLMVDGDGARLSQAFTTVIRNAAEAIDETGTVHVSAVTEGDGVAITVSDDGRGMDEQDVAELFDIDFASSRTIRARFGLAACRSVVHGHGGDIEIKSSVGEGTVVRIRLPLR